MSSNTADVKRLERRGFLKGSALFAAAFALAGAAPAAAQDPQNRPAPEDEKKDEAPKTGEADKKPKPLVDKDGREFRVCEMCGANMYKQENTWSCDQCGYSYEE